jgi:hypothetical protein
LQISVDRKGWQVGSAVDFLLAGEQGRTVIEDACIGLMRQAAELLEMRASMGSLSQVDNGRKMVHLST